MNNWIYLSRLIIIIRNLFFFLALITPVLQASASDEICSIPEVVRIASGLVNYVNGKDSSSWRSVVVDGAQERLRAKDLAKEERDLSSSNFPQEAACRLTKSHLLSASLLALRGNTGQLRDDINAKARVKILIELDNVISYIKLAEVTSSFANSTSLEKEVSMFMPTLRTVLRNLAESSNAIRLPSLTRNSSNRPIYRVVGSNDKKIEIAEIFFNDDGIETELKEFLFTQPHKNMGSIMISVPQRLEDNNARTINKLAEAFGVDVNETRGNSYIFNTSNAGQLYAVNSEELQSVEDFTRLATLILNNIPYSSFEQPKLLRIDQRPRAIVEPPRNSINEPQPSSPAYVTSKLGKNGISNMVFGLLRHGKVYKSCNAELPLEVLDAPVEGTSRQYTIQQGNHVFVREIVPFLIDPETDKPSTDVWAEVELEQGSVILKGFLKYWIKRTRDGEITFMAGVKCEN